MLLLFLLISTCLLSGPHCFGLGLYYAFIRLFLSRNNLFSPLSPKIVHLTHSQSCFFSPPPHCYHHGLELLTNQETWVTLITLNPCPLSFPLPFVWPRNPVMLSCSTSLLTIPAVLSCPLMLTSALLTYYQGLPWLIYLLLSLYFPLIIS